MGLGGPGVDGLGDVIRGRMDWRPGVGCESGEDGLRDCDPREDRLEMRTAGENFRIKKYEIKLWPTTTK